MKEHTVKVIALLKWGKIVNSKIMLVCSFMLAITWAIVLNVSAGEIPGPAVPAIDFNKLLDPDLLLNKTVSELWLSRNEIYARHGRCFMNYELNSYFMDQSWYKPNEQYSESMLSKVELANAVLLQKEEDKRHRTNYIEKNSQQVVNLDNVYNIFQYPEFSAEEKEKLGQNGFVTLPTEYNQLFHVYENNDYLGIPSFISTDSVLQLYHLFFDMSLRNLEQNYLSKTLNTLCQEILKNNDQVYNQATNELLKQAAFNNSVYLLIPSYFINGGQFNLDVTAGQIAKGEIEFCKAHPSWTDSPLLKRKFDYSQFIPRGHYTRNETLKNYFMAMMWLGLAGIEMKNDNLGLLQGMIITDILYTKKSSVDGRPLIELWKEIYEPTVFYVGLADDLGPDDFKEAMEKVLGKNYTCNDFNDSKKIAKIREILVAKFKQKTKIAGRGIWGTQGPQFRIMGQRFIPDSYFFDRLTIIDRDRQYFRYFPDGLDVMAVFGSETAKKIMLTEEKDSWAEWPEYPDKLNELIKEYSGLSEKEWKHNLYYNWLWCLKSLIVLKDEHKYPFFMKTEGWKRKSLNTSLGSWAELRHDTILYAKQSCVAECGNGGGEIRVWIPEPPKGYVEPNLEFYKKMEDLLNFTRTELTTRKIMDARMTGLCNQFTDLVAFLETISRKEMDNIPRTLQEYEQIQKLGSLLDNLTLEVLRDPDSAKSWDYVGGPDKNMPVIADVHTADFKALEVGVGKAHEMYVIVEIEGKLKLTRGAIFSYYEFPWEATDRLTDEKWQEILGKGNAPELPKWSDYFRSPSKEGKKLRPLYKPKIEDVPDWSPEPGWKTIPYYETGC